MFVIQHNLHILSLMRISCEEDENVKNIYVFAWRVQSLILMVLQRMSGGREWGVGSHGAILQNKHTDIFEINTIRLKISILLKHA